MAAANGAAAAAPARTTFTPKPKAPPPVRPKTGPYAKDTKFLDEVRELLQADRAIYQEQATSLRAEADSLALEREPGDVQFDEESGEGGTVTVDRERNLALSGQALLAVEEIDDALRRIDDKTYGYCERCFQPIPKPRLRALPYARLCVACKSGGCRGADPLRRPGVCHRRRRGGGRPGDDVARRGPPPRRAPRLGALRAWLSPTTQASPSASSAGGPSSSRLLLCIGVVVLALVVAQVRTVPLAVGAGLVLGGAVGNLSERIFGGHGGQVPDFITLSYWPTFNLADACVTVGVVIVIVALLFGGVGPRREPEGRRKAGVSGASPTLSASPGWWRGDHLDRGPGAAGGGPGGPRRGHGGRRVPRRGGAADRSGPGPGRRFAGHGGPGGAPEGATLTIVLPAV